MYDPVNIFFDVGSKRGTLMADDEVYWTFHGYVTPAGGNDVQEWFNALDADAKDEVRDALAYLQRLPLAQWKKPTFYPLGSGLGEVRIKANELKQVYRVYGFNWPRGKRWTYTLLLGNDKKVSNPQDDIAKARKRQSEVEQGKATVHEFDFED